MTTFFAGEYYFIRAALLRYFLSSEFKRNVYNRRSRIRAVELEDVSRLRLYFNGRNLEILQQEIAFNFFIFKYYFSVRGWETLPHMDNNSVIIEHDSTGRGYMNF